MPFIFLFSNKMNLKICIVLLSFMVHGSRGNYFEYSKFQDNFNKDKLFRPGDDTYLATSDEPITYDVFGRSNFVFAAKGEEIGIVLLGPKVNVLPDKQGRSQWTMTRADITIGHRGKDIEDRAYIQVQQEHADADGGDIMIVTSDYHHNASDSFQGLHISEFRYFWVRWDDDGVAVGQGPLVGEQVTLRVLFTDIRNADGDQNLDLVLPIPSFHRVEIWGYGSSILKVPENSGDQLHFMTKDLMGYSHMWKEIPAEGSMNFHVKACPSKFDTSPKFLLSQEFGKKSSRFIEITIQEGAVRIDGSRFDDTTFRNPIKTGHTLLDCKRFKQIWFAWTSNRLRVGYGPRDRGQVLLETKFGRSDLLFARYLAITSQAEAHWQFDDSLEITTYFSNSGQSLTPQCEINHAPEKPGDLNQAHYCNFWAELMRGQYFQFSVASPDVVPLVLSELTFLGTNDIEVFLRNGKSLVRRGGDILESSDDEDVIDGDEYRSFWLAISSQGGNGNWLMIGKGHAFGENFLFPSIRIEDSMRIKYIGLGQVSGITSWKVGDMFGQAITAYTYPNTWHHNFWRHTQARNFVVFNVDVAYNAVIALANSPMDTTKDMQEWFKIMLYSDPKDIRVYLLLPNAEMKVLDLEINDHGIKKLIGEGINRQMWLAWPRPGHISLGVGPLPGHHVLFDTTVEDFGLEMNAVRFETNGAWGTDVIPKVGTWSFSDDGGDGFINFLAAETSLKGKNWVYVGLDTTWTSFEVRAESNVELILAYEMYNENEGIELILQKDGHLSTLRVLGQSVAGRTDKQFLDKIESRHFFIQWKPNTNGDGYRLQIGTGNIPRGDNLLFEEVEIPRPIQAMNFYPGLYSEALFLWKENSANWGRFMTDGASNKELTLSVDHHQSLVFSVQACKDVALHLYENAGFKEQYAYLVRLGVENNKESDIQTPSGSAIRSIGVSRKTPDLLSCTEMRHFWITWYTGQIRIGKGPNIGEDFILDFQELRPEEVRVISFSTFSKEEAYWEFPMLTATELQSIVPEPETEPFNHITAIIIGVVVFLILVVAAGLATFLIKTDDNPCSKLFAKGDEPIEKRGVAGSFAESS